MKKLKLKALQLGTKEVLSRTQLKNVLGGNDVSKCKSTGFCDSDSDCDYFCSCNTTTFSDGSVAKYCG